MKKSFIFLCVLTLLMSCFCFAACGEPAEVNPLKKIRADAITELEIVFDAKIPTDYSDEGWISLSENLIGGINKINAAKTAEKVEEEKQAAITAINMVLTKAQIELSEQATT